MTISSYTEKQLDSSQALQTAADVRALSQILKPFHIQHFCYLKLFTDGSHILLCTDPEWVKCFYLHHYSHAAHHRDPRAYRSGFELWDAVPDQSTATVAREQFNIAHGIALIDQTGDECELFNFATTRDKPAIANFYLNNLELLRQFSSFFKERGQKLIQTADTDRLLLPHWLEPTETELQQRFSNLKLDEQTQQVYWSKVANRRYKFATNFNEYITAREMSCMLLLARGLTTKQMAVQLGVSSRTIEAHFDNLRARLNCRTKFELVAKIVKNFPQLF